MNNHYDAIKMLADKGSGLPPMGLGRPRWAGKRWTKIRPYHKIREE
jgi:hypothetical protein